jgi:hypothetical protein
MYFIRNLLTSHCLLEEKSCFKGMTLNFWTIQAIWNKSINIVIFIPNLPPHLRSKVVTNNIIIGISVCKYKFTGVRLRERPRSIKSWVGSQLCAPKVFPQGYSTPDNDLWLCRNYLNNNIC